MTTSLKSALLAALCENPDDTATRAALFDHLEESGAWDWECHTAFVCADPGSDELRLRAAQWCEENGQAERGEFIRLQVQIARRPAKPPIATLQDIRLRRRERDLLDTHGADWFRADRDMNPGLPVDRNAWYYRPLPSMITDRYFLGFNRGFLGVFNGPAADWLAHADQILRQQPVQMAWLTALTGKDMERFIKRWSACHRGYPFGHTINAVITDLWPRVRFELPAPTHSTSNLPSPLFTTTNPLG